MNCLYLFIHGGEGGSLIFSYIRRLRPFLGVQNFEFNIFGGFQKNEDFVDIFLFWGGGGEMGAHHKIGLYLWVISVHFGVFS